MTTSGCASKKAHNLPMASSSSVISGFTTAWYTLSSRESTVLCPAPNPTLCGKHSTWTPGPHCVCSNLWPVPSGEALSTKYRENSTRLCMLLQAAGRLHGLVIPAVCDDTGAYLCFFQHAPAPFAASRAYNDILY